MARDMNPFALLGEDDEGDSDLLALAQSAAAKKPKPEKKSPASEKPQAQLQPAKLPFKPLPPAEAVRAERGRGRGTGRGRGGGRGFGGSGGFNGGVFGSGGGRGSEGGGEFSDGFGGGRGGGRGFGEEDGGGRGFARGRGRGRGRSGRGGGRFGGGPSDGDGFDGPPRRQFESDAPSSQWEAPEGSFVDEHKNMEPEVNKPEEEATQDIATENKEEKKEEEDKEMTLDEYEKLLNDKRKALEALKNEERKVPLDRDFEFMHLVNKKKDDGIFIKVNSEKDKLRKKEGAEKDDKVRKAVSINEFLKPVDGEKFYTPTGTRGRGRGRGRGGGRGYGGTTRGAFTGFAGRYNDADEVAAPHIEDPVQFPVLAAK